MSLHVQLWGEAGRQSMKEMMCERQKRGWGNDRVQDGTEMYREWIMSQRIHLSITHIKVHFSNGVFTKWALAVFNSPGSLLCRKHLALKKKANIVFGSLFASNRVSFPPTLSFICLCCPSLSSLSVSVKKWWMKKYILEQAWIQTGYISIISAPLFPERPSHQFQINQVEHILATDYLFLVLVYTWCMFLPLKSFLTVIWDWQEELQSQRLRSCACLCMHGI